jgi:hypothetical protein
VHQKSRERGPRIPTRIYHPGPVRASVTSIDLSLSSRTPRRLRAAAGAPRDVSKPKGRKGSREQGEAAMNAEDGLIYMERNTWQVGG